MSESRYIIGVDLGTSNSAMAFVDTEHTNANTIEETATVQTFAIPQVTAPGAVEDRSTLPSVIYIRGESELPAGALNLPWREDPGFCVGHLAREQGSKIPSRMIHSSKSWLCHPHVNHEEKFLPYQSREEDAKRSPVQAALLMLEHLKSSWKHKMGAGNDDYELFKQQLVLCVPASFDAAARNLTVSAAQRIGFQDITLLEEPQAAVHSWIEQTGRDWRDQLQIGDILLVVDVGGGTTDFSLIGAHEVGGELELRRIAVGEHILLGGDNMDLALAYYLAEDLQEDYGKLDPFQFNTLIQQCRIAKEELLADPEKESYPIVILGRGKSVIGGTIKTELQREGFEELLVNGFFPHCALTDRPARARRSGFREAGLPYASDPAITLHLARFLGSQHEALQEFFPEREADKTILPTAILFNGGVFRAHRLQKRVMEVISSWCEESICPAPRVLEGANLDLAVARGAAYLGIAKRGKGIRIRGGSPRSYYIGVESATPAVPGMPTRLKAMCVVPHGMEEGTSQDISGEEIDLCIWTGEPAVFRFLSSTTRRHDQPGQIEDVDEEEFVEHSPVETTLRDEAIGEQEAEGRAVEVDLRSQLTEIGTLDLCCVERGTDKGWQLEFNVRNTETEEE